MSSTDQQSPSVIPLNSMAQAERVVRALRSQKASRERYQDFNQNAMDVKSLNTAILTVRKDQENHAVKKAEVDRRIDNWKASSVRVEEKKRADSCEKDEDSENEDEEQHKSQPKQRNHDDDDDFDFGDDPDDDRELFKDFVAPKANNGASSKNSLKSSGKQLSTASTTQQPSLITSKGYAIKPGQAIRVKAHGNRNKFGAVNDF